MEKAIVGISWVLKTQVIDQLGLIVKRHDHLHSRCVSDGGSVGGETGAGNVGGWAVHDGTRVGVFAFISCDNYAWVANPFLVF